MDELRKKLEGKAFQHYNPVYNLSGKIIYLSDALSIIGEYVPKWISVKDGLPKKFVNVLAISNGGRISITCVDSGGKLDDFNIEEQFGGQPPLYYTHWMPLPDPDKEG